MTWFDRGLVVLVVGCSLALLLAGVVTVCAATDLLTLALGVSLLVAGGVLASPLIPE